MLNLIESKVQAGARVTVEEAAYLYQHAEDATLKRLATMVRSRFHNQDEATYLIMAIVNYTNVCVAKCDYCAFYRLPGQEGAYLLDINQVSDRVQKLVEHGGDLIGFNGGFHPELRVEDYANLFHEIHKRFPQLAFYELTVAEFMFICKVSKVSYSEGAQAFQAAGTRWITGGGAEVLEENFRRRHSPLKYTVEDYYRAQLAILEAGMGSTATMTIGFDETLEERMLHLSRLRAFQDETGGALRSFLVWTYKPDNTPLGGIEIQSDEYIRWVAICRIFLDNFVHIRASVLTQNQRAMAALTFGANDFDLPTDDEVTQMAGATISHDFESILNAAVAAGVKPIKRAPFSRVRFPRVTL